jgi:hypothetical protein
MNETTLKKPYFYKPEDRDMNESTLKKIYSMEVRNDIWTR